MSVNQLKQLSVRDSSLNLRCESLICNSIIQPSSSVNTYHLPAPIAQTVSMTGTKIMVNVASFAAATQQFYYYNISNPDIGANDVLQATLVNMNTDIGMAGAPLITCYVRGAGSGRLYIINTSTTSSFTSTYQIYLEVIKIQ
jgi:hypothetical protein